MNPITQRANGPSHTNGTGSLGRLSSFQKNHTVPDTMNAAGDANDRQTWLLANMIVRDIFVNG